MRYEEVDWVLAGCTGTDPTVWFPDGNTGGQTHPMIERICGACWIKEDCLSYAIEADEVGVWGGVHFKENRRLNSGIAGEVHTAGDGDPMQEMRGETP